MDIAGAAFDRLKQKRRGLTGRTGCGVCGTESLAMLAQRAAASARRAGFAASIVAGAASLTCATNHQSADRRFYAAAFADAAGNLLMVREDVGRHNALDKLIGALQSLPVEIRSQGMVLMTSRASYELIVKTCRAGIPTLACVSAPTTLAVQLAKQSGLCLAGFARGQACVVYAHAERVGD
jgi:FdhD protein